MSKIDKSTDGTEYAEQVESLAYNLLSIIGKFAFTTPIQNWIFSDFAKTAPALVEYMYKMLSCDTPEIRREVIKMLPKIPHLDSCSVQECESVEVFFRSLCRDPKTEKQLFFVWVCCSLMKSQPILEKELDFTQITNDNIDVYLQALQRIFAPQLSDAELVLKGATFKRAMLYLQERSKLQGVKDVRLELIRRRTEIVQNPTLFQELIEPILAESRQERVTKMHEKIAQQVEETVPVAQTISSSEEVSVLTEAVEVSPQQVTVKSETAGYHRAIKDCLQWLPEDDPRRLQLQTALESGFYDKDIAHKVILPIIKTQGELVRSKKAEKEVFKSTPVPEKPVSPSLLEAISGVIDVLPENDPRRDALEINKELYVRDPLAFSKEVQPIVKEVLAKHAAWKGAANRLLREKGIESSERLSHLLATIGQKDGELEFRRSLSKLQAWQNNPDNDKVDNRLKLIDALLVSLRMGAETKERLKAEKTNVVLEYPLMSEESFQKMLDKKKKQGEFEFHVWCIDNFLDDPEMSEGDRNFVQSHKDTLFSSELQQVRGEIFGRFWQRRKTTKIVRYYDIKNKDGKIVKKKVYQCFDPKYGLSAKEYIQVQDENGRVYAINRKRLSAPKTEKIISESSNEQKVA